MSRLFSAKDEIRLFGTERDNFRLCISLSTDLWIGTVGDEIICCYGLSPSSVISDRAYLWLYTLEAFKGNEFFFVRHSQRAIEDMLEIFPTITGVADPVRTNTIRWLRWLGAEFAEVGPGQLEFIIRRKP